MERLHTATVGAELGNGNDWTFQQRERYLDEQAKKEAEQRKREEHDSPYEVWAQLNLEPAVCQARRQLIRDCPCAAVILDLFIQYSYGYNNAVIVSQRTLSEALGYSVTAINTAVKLLIERGFVSTMRSGNAVIYTLNPDVSWKTWGKNYKYCEMHATLLLGKNEQEKPVKITKNRTIVLKKDSKPRKKDSQPRGKDSSLTGKDSQPTEDDVWEDCLPDEGECPEE